MKRTLRVFVGILSALGLTISTAGAQCAFEHPEKARSFRSALTQAFLSCGGIGGATPNTTTEGGVPACVPPETFNELNGSPADGWLWGPSSYGSLSIKAAKNKVVDMLNPPTNTQDMIASLVLKQVFDANGAVANAPGTLQIIIRATIEDRDGGDMTVIDFPFDFPFTVQGNAVSAKFSFNARLNEDDLPGFPGCSSIEILYAAVVDANGNRFADVGVFLPDLD